METPLRLFASLALAAGLLHCTLRDERVCTMLPCASAATLRAALAPADAAPGPHAFALEADGVASTCKVEVTSTTSLAHGTCTSNASVHLGPVMRSKEMLIAGMVGFTEEPVPEKFEWQLTVYGQPRSLRVVHTTGGRTVLDRTAALTYQESRPNGHGCEPVCQAAKAELTGP